jgi:hypothetical protein
MTTDPASLLQAWRARFGRDTALLGFGQPLPAGSVARILLLLDVSGSMKGTRIGTARLVLRQFLRSLDSLPAGAVRVAIAPFGSVEVAPRIEAASFTRPDSAAREIDDLPAPDRENTALYSAVALATDRLGRELRSAPPAAVGLLVVVTDGNNDIRAGDDAGLLQGAGGLARAAETVGASPAGVGIVGIGNLDQAALRTLAGPRGLVLPVAAGAGAFELGQRLGQILRMLGASWEVTIPLGSASRGELGRRPGTLLLDLAAGSERVRGGSALWRPPLVALPAFAGTVPRGVLSLSRAETPASWVGSALLAAFVVLLLIEVWIVLPRFLWPPVPVAAAVPGPAGGREKASKAAPGALRADLKEAAPRKPTDVTAARARRV